jgi:leucyl aminopeptidase
MQGDAMDAWIMATDADGATPLLAVDRSNFGAVADLFGTQARRWCAANGFAGEPGRFVLIPGADGAPSAVLAG